MKISAIFILALILTARLSQAQDVPVPVPSFTSDNAVESTDKSKVSFPVSSGPEFIVPTSDLLAIAANMQSKDNVVSITVRPLRLLHKNRWLWGFSLLGTYQTDKEITTLGTSYRFEPRWIFESSYSNEVVATHKKLEAQHSGGLKSDDFLREFMMEVDRSKFSLLPAITVGYQIGLFANDMSGEERKDVAKQNITMGLNWSYGNYLDLQGTFAIGRQRADAVTNTKIVDVTSGSASLIWIMPWLVGTDYYDTYYLKNLYQRGIGIGPVFSYTECGATGDDRSSCPNSIIRDQLLGAAIDLRIIKDITPRFTIGERHITKFKAAKDGSASSVEAGVQLVYTFK